MRQIGENVLLECGKCGNQFNQPVFIEYLASYERNMGDETEYGFDEEFKCPNCKNLICVKKSYFEYPLGAYNSDSEDTKGGRLLEAPSIEFMDEIDMMDDDY